MTTTRHTEPHLTAIDLLVAGKNLTEVTAKVGVHLVTGSQRVHHPFGSGLAQRGPTSGLAQQTACLHARSVDVQRGPRISVMRGGGGCRIAQGEARGRAASVVAPQFAFARGGSARVSRMPQLDRSPLGDRGLASEWRNTGNSS